MSALRNRHRSDYELVWVKRNAKTTKPEVIWIKDLDRGRNSVTNDAECVVAELAAKYPGARIIYLDSDSTLGELKHVDGKFTGFAPAPEPELRP